MTFNLLREHCYPSTPGLNVSCLDQCDSGGTSLAPDGDLWSARVYLEGKYTSSRVVTFAL